MIIWPIQKRCLVFEDACNCLLEIVVHYVYLHMDIRDVVAVLGVLLGGDGRNDMPCFARLERRGGCAI